MEDYLFNTLLVVGIAGWVRPFFDRPSRDQINDVSSQIGSRNSSLVYLTISLCLSILSLGGLVGMFFDREIFRWGFLTGTIGMISASWFLPVAHSKPRRDVFFAEVSRVMDGAILALAFTI
jgi:hypothetical protein